MSNMTDPYAELFQELLRILPRDVRAFAALRPSNAEIKQEILDTIAVRDGYRAEARMAATDIANPQFVQRRLDELQKAYDKAKADLENFKARMENIHELKQRYTEEAIRLDKRARSLKKLAAWKEMVDKAVDVVGQVEATQRKELRKKLNEEVERKD